MASTKGQYYLTLLIFENIEKKNTRDDMLPTREQKRQNDGEKRMRVIFTMTRLKWRAVVGRPPCWLEIWCREESVKVMLCRQASATEARDKRFALNTKQASIQPICSGPIPRHQEPAHEAPSNGQNNAPPVLRFTERTTPRSCHASIHRRPTMKCGTSIFNC